MDHNSTLEPTDPLVLYPKSGSPDIYSVLDQVVTYLHDTKDPLQTDIVRVQHDDETNTELIHSIHSLVTRNHWILCNKRRILIRGARKERHKIPNVANLSETGLQHTTDLYILDNTYNNITKILEFMASKEHEEEGLRILHIDIDTDFDYKEDFTDLLEILGKITSLEYRYVTFDDLERDQTEVLMESISQLKNLKSFDVTIRDDEDEDSEYEDSGDEENFANYMMIDVPAASNNHMTNVLAALVINMTNAPAALESYATHPPSSLESLTFSSFKPHDTPCSMRLFDWLTRSEGNPGYALKKLTTSFECLYHNEEGRSPRCDLSKLVSLVITPELPETGITILNNDLIPKLKKLQVLTLVLPVHLLEDFLSLNLNDLPDLQKLELLFEGEDGEYDIIRNNVALVEENFLNLESIKIITLYLKHDTHYETYNFTAQGTVVTQIRTS